MLTLKMRLAMAVLLLACLLPLPYGVYILIRLFATIGFVMLAVEYHRSQRPLGIVAVVFLALVFQPLLRLPLTREVWIAVDVVVAAGLILDYFVTKRRYRLQQRLAPGQNPADSPEIQASVCNGGCSCKGEAIVESQIRAEQAQHAQK